MVHPTRGHLANRRMWRMHPNRTIGELLDHDGKTVIACLTEMFWTDVEERDRGYLGNYTGEARVWHLPDLFIDTTVEPGMRVVASDGTTWEIRRGVLRSGRSIWHCPSVEMRERS